MNEKGAVFDQVASAQAPCLEQHAMEPLEAVLPHPARSARHIAADDVETRTAAYSDIGLAFIQVGLYPPLLLRGSQRSQYDPGVDSLDPFNHLGVLPRPKLEWRRDRVNRGYWEPLLHLLRGARRHPWRRADARDRATSFGGDLGAFPNQVGAVDPPTERRAQQRGRPHDGHAIGRHQAGSPYFFGEDRVTLRFHHEIHIARDDMQSPVFDDGAPDVSHGLVKRNGVKRTTEDINS